MKAREKRIGLSAWICRWLWKLKRKCKEGSDSLSAAAAFFLSSFLEAMSQRCSNAVNCYEMRITLALTPSNNTVRDYIRLITPL